MCESCELSLPQVRPSAALIARAREIEAALPGARVDADAFDVFFGRRGGSIPWPQYQRLVQCMEAAVESLPKRVLSCDDAATTPSPPLGAERVGVRWGRTNHTAIATGGARRLSSLHSAGAEASPTSP